MEDICKTAIKFNLVISMKIPLLCKQTSSHTGKNTFILANLHNQHRKQKLQKKKPLGIQNECLYCPYNYIKDQKKSVQDLFLP